MNVNAQIPQQWWERLRWTRHGFLAGLLVGIAAGWFFHGLISFIVRFGLVLLLLLPLLVIGWFWLRSSRSERASRPATGERRVMTWATGQFASPRRFTDETSESPEDVVDIGPSRRTERGDVTSRSRQPVPPDVERELQALKREQERGR